MSEPLLCRLGFHKWRNYGDEVEVFWQEPKPVKAGAIGCPHSFGTSVGSPKSNIGDHSKVVYEGRKCTRCGMKLRRKFVTNSDGTLSCAGWESDTERPTKSE